MRTSLAIVAGIACMSCNSGAPKQADVASGSGSAVAETPPRVGPHSGAIERIAITDDGGAAYTIDTFGQARLWLSLDGTREPVVVRGGRATRVTLGRTDEGFVAALLDEAGGIELVRFDRDGRTRGHVTLPPEPGFVDVVAVEGGVLARRRDESLVWYDAGGHARGQIVPDAGERISGLAARHGRAIAALSGAESRGRITLRWILFGQTLAWGTRPRLEAAVEAPIALSPDGTKISAIDASTKRFEIVDLTSGLGLYAQSIDSATVSDAPVMGFLDDNTALFSDVRGTVWWALAQKDPWATSRRGTPSEASDIAVGDHVMLDASSTSLTLTTERSMKYLGYRDVGPSVLWPTTTGMATQRGSTSVWLDRDLRERATQVAPSAQVSAIISDRHLVISEAGRIYILDAETREEKSLGAFAEAAGVTFDAASRVIAVTMQREVVRYQVQLSPFTVTPLASLAVEKDYGQTIVMDPKTASGVIAVLSSHDAGKIRLDWYRDRPAATALTRTAVVAVKQPSMPIGADRRGVVYFVDRAESKLLMMQLDHPDREIPLDVGDIATAAPHPDGTLVYVATGSEIIAIDTATGAQHWKLAVPGIDTLKLGSDGQTLFASAQGGMVSLEARSGARIATACGWNFGLHDDQVSAQVFAVPNLCAGLE